MSASTSQPLPTPELVARLVAAERQCMTDWLQAVADLPGNPYGIAIKTFGQATALVCRAIPAQVVLECSQISRRRHDVAVGQDVSIGMDDEARPRPTGTRFNHRRSLGSIARGDFMSAGAHRLRDLFDRSTVIPEFGGCERTDAHDGRLHLIRHLLDVIELCHIGPARGDGDQGESDQGADPHRATGWTIVPGARISAAVPRKSRRPLR